MVKTSQERFYEDLARQVVKESLALSANIESGSNICRIEIQLGDDDKDTINVTLGLPMTKEAALEEIRRQLSPRR